MTISQVRFNKLHSAKVKLEVELNNNYGEIKNAVDKQDRKVETERLIVKCKDAFIRVVDKKEELFDLAQKTEDPDAACKNLEKWLETVTKKTDELIAAARGYIYINPFHDNETAELCTSHPSRSGSHITSSKSSSLRQRDLKLSRLKREELEKQHEAKLRISRHRLEIEKQTKLRELEIEQLEEHHRKEVAAAAPENIELMTKSSADGSGVGKMSGLFTERSSVKNKKIVQDCVNSSPAGNIWLMLQTNRVCVFLVQSPNQTKQLFNDLLQLNFQTHTLISIHMVKLRPTSTSLSMSRENQVVEPM